MTDAGSDFIVRVGTLDDMEAMMEAAMLGHEENAFVKVNPEKMATDIWHALAQDHGIVGIVGKPGGIIEGAVVLRMGTMWYSDDPVVEEKAIFIRPEYRSAKGGRARKLCEFSKKVADSLGIPLIIGVLSNHRTAAKVRLYRRQFGEPAGAFFLYGAKTGEIE
jgi:hypothetical protein